MRRLLVLLPLFCLGCDGEAATDAGPPAVDAGPGVTLPTSVGPADRPAGLVSSGSYDGTTPRPLLVLLHGYGASGSAQAIYFQLDREVRRRDWLMLTPDGTRDFRGSNFWNATPACCDFGETGVDDVAYLNGLIDEVEALAPISAVYFVGHSNGGFMSYRMACESSERISAIASLAGSDFNGDMDCEPSQPVSVLQIHGTMDGTIAYDGSMERGGYPSAPAAAERWATRAGCDLTAATAGANLDLTSGVDGAETETLDYQVGCSGAEVSLWTLVDGGHIPAITRDFAPALLEWLDARAR